MHRRMLYSTLGGVALVIGSSGLVAGQVSSGAIDPSGSWRWEQDTAGVLVENVLKLNVEGKRVTGTHQGRGKPVKISNGKIDGDKLSFDLIVEHDGEKYAVSMSGTINGDKLVGKADVTGSGFADVIPWMAKRSLETSDVVGEWNLELDTQEGLKKSRLKITLTPDTELAAKLTGSGGDFVEVANLAVEKGQLRFTVTGEVDCTFFTAEYETRPLGDKLTGTMEYDYGGQTGELTVKGKRDQD